MAPLKLPKEGQNILVKSSIEIKNATFDGAIDFRRATFQKLIIFDLDQFSGLFDIRFSQFNEIAHFTKSLFKKDARFLGSHFNRQVYFDESQFTRESEFAASYFGADVNFMRSHFCRGANFNGSHFEGKTYFLASRFDEDTYFSDITFNDLTLFNRCVFGDYAGFAKCRFKIANFNGSSFRGYAEFKDSQFNGDASFVASKFSDRSNFESASFSGSLAIDNSEIHSMNLFATFNKGSSLSLKHSQFYRLEVNWRDIRDKLDYDGSAYLALVKNYNDLEWFEDADNCYQKYRTERRARLEGLRKLLDTIPLIAYGYGVHPEYPLAGMVLIFLISAVFYWFGGQAHTLKNAFDLSVVILTTTTQIGGLTGTCRFWSIFERILGWMLMSTFLVTLGKKMLR